MNQFERKKEEIKALVKYPELYRHPGYTIQAKKDYEDIKKENGILDNFYYELPYKLTSQQKSDVRHPFAAAVLAQKYPEQFVRELGQYKEDIDILDNKPLWDTEQDLKNNEYGIELGKNYPTAPNIILFDKILMKNNLSVPTRNNTLYGYITNTNNENL